MYSYLYCAVLLCMLHGVLSFATDQHVLCSFWASAGEVRCVLSCAIGINRIAIFSVIKTPGICSIAVLSLAMQF